jgi:hypothetical protein
VAAGVWFVGEAGMLAAASHAVLDAGGLIMLCFAGRRRTLLQVHECWCWCDVQAGPHPAHPQLCTTATAARGFLSEVPVHACVQPTELHASSNHAALAP